MKRRAFIAALGTAAAWPVLALGQSMPTVGFLISASQTGYAPVMGPILNGLAEAGYVDGKNVRIEYRWADYHYDRLPALAADLVGRQVALIFCTGSVVSALAAKSATSTIPIVFANGSDPVKYGLVASLNRPGGNISGVTFCNSGLGPKRIEVLRQLVPTAHALALLVNPKNPNAQPDGAEIREAGWNVGVQVQIINASTEKR